MSSTECSSENCKLLFECSAFQPTATERVSEGEKKKTHNYLTNLNPDPALTGYICHFLEGDMTIGNKRGEKSDICLSGRYNVAIVARYRILKTLVTF